LNTIKPSHDKLATRLTQILIKLNQGEKLSPAELAKEFDVSLRTIQRDLNERFSYLPFKKENGFFALEPYYLGKLNSKDIERFASLSGVKSLFPAINTGFIRELFDNQIQQAYLVKGHHYEDLTASAKFFTPLEQAIISHKILSFQYKSKEYQQIEPYKLINHKGIWYLAAKHQDKLKTFCLNAIQQLNVSVHFFQHDGALEKIIQQEDSIWFGEKYPVRLKINAEVASYFTRRNLVPNQKIEHHLENGGLIISASISNNRQILPIIRYWLPNIEILHPDSLHEQLIKSLQAYLN